jgi:transcription antitermination factor NusG
VEIAKFPWYVVRVRSNFERTASVSFQEKGYETFLPVYRCRRRWADRVKQVDQPLFPGYTFCRFDAQKRLPILQTPGVVSILGSSLGPIPVEDHEVESVSRMLASSLPVGPWPFLGQGQYVVVERGPLSGLEGLVIEVKAKFRLVVSVTLLNRSVYAEIDREWVRPTSAPSLPRSDGYKAFGQNG